MTQVFRAKLSADQTLTSSSTTFTTIALDTAAPNEGGYFNTTTYEWTPPAGAISLNGSLSFKNAPDGSVFQLRITKNGSPVDMDEGRSTGLFVSIFDRATGTDVYKIEALGTDSSGFVTVNANANKTFFNGVAHEV